MLFANELEVLKHFEEYENMEHTNVADVKIERVLFSLGYECIDYQSTDFYKIIKYVKPNYDLQKGTYVIVGHDKETGNGIFAYWDDEYESVVKSNKEAEEIKAKIEFLEKGIDPYVEMNDTRNYWTIKRHNEKLEEEIKKLKGML